mgnify:CR=1 FL=1
MGINYGRYVNRKGVILHYDAANIKSYSTSGTVWRDLSGGNHHGDLLGGVSYLSEFKGALSFNGSDQVCVTQLPAATIGESFSALCYFTKEGVGNSSATANRLLSADRTNNATKWCIGLRRNGNLQFGGRGGIDTSLNFPIPHGKPTFVALVHNHDEYSLWIDNEKVVDRQSSSIDSQSNGNLAIGGRTRVTDRYWEGNIYEVKVFDKLLTDSEVSRFYQTMKLRFT